MLCRLFGSYDGFRVGFYKIVCCFVCVAFADVVLIVVCVVSVMLIMVICCCSDADNGYMLFQ
jgi:hypothetical protein